jgi:hypothetical protein
MRDEVRVSPTRSSIGRTVKSKLQTMHLASNVGVSVLIYPNSRLEVGSLSRRSKNPTPSAVKFLVDVCCGLKRVGMDGIR